MQTSLNTSTTSTCYHCGENCKNEEISIENKKFCCDGCKLVYEILNENDLCKYYDITKTPGITVKGKFISEKFAYLDDEKVKQKLISFTNGDQTNVTFYLPQMHCSSCIWLLENLNRINADIVRSQVDFPRKEVSIFFNEGKTTLRKIVELLTFIGYEPQISLSDLETKKEIKHNRKQLFKIGFAGFCFGNIMMLSFPDYFSFGIIEEPGLKQFMSYLILGLSLPVFFYSASEFFISAWKGIQQRFLNIDAPISFAILVTFVRSVYEIISNTGAGYMDSMSGIVFFMLIGRFFQNRTYDTLSFERDYKSYFPIAVTVIKNNVEKATPVSDIKVGDRILIRNNELIPTDAILFRGDASIDYSFVTGESAPNQKVVGEIVYAGGKQIGSAIELEVIKEVSQSYLTQLWNNDAFKQNEKVDVSFVNQTGKYFTVILFALAIGGFLFWLPTDLHRALNALTAVLIVACPCALLLSSTFTNGNMLRIFGRNKFYLKNAGIIEKLGNIDTIVFDKTGTITQNNESIIEYDGKALSAEEQQLIRSLVVQSSHPLSKRILDHLPLSKKLDATYFKEHTGRGMESIIDGFNLKLGSYEFIYGKPNTEQKEATSSVVYVMIEGNIYGNYLIKNQYRNGFVSLVRSLESEFKLALLSGDNDSEKKYLSTIFSKNASLNFNQSPGSKLSFIKTLQAQKHKVLMIGDGLNDAGALKQSDVGIAVSDDINNFSPSCDAILDGSRFNDLKNYIDFAKAGKNIIIASFIVSLLYNVVGLGIAVNGTLSPVIAAILMPISSITIVLFTTMASTIVAKRKGM
ncbi:MAG: ATPase [Bacteroidetes bacterium RIFCSPLOWO2_12_FULL_35_15]|nr:MAG: ATPase [Bacteroidetes bacterium RIFCSPLOWO2_12_FULL_35_15]